MTRKSKGAIPSSREVTRRVKCLGLTASKEYFQLRDGYKPQGLTPKESVDRACTELRVLERYDDWRARETAKEMLGKQVPMTPAEVQVVLPSYQMPGVTKAEHIGKEELSLAEEAAWAMKWAARVQNGEDSPTKFPNEGALFLFQSAVANRREFEKLWVRVRSPSGSEDDAYLQDGQYQIKEITRQLKEAVRECGDRLVEMESGFSEILKEELV